MNRHGDMTSLRGVASRLGMLSIAFALVLSPTLAAAKPGTRNLGGGLEQVATPEAAAKALATSKMAVTDKNGKSSVLEVVRPLVQDKAGRPLVRVTLDGKVPFATVLQSLKGIPGVEVKASDAKYRKGAIEAYVPATALQSIAKQKGVLAVVPSSPMMTNVGLTDSQGIVQHRVDKIPGVDGSGITVGVMSDSYDVAPAITFADDDVASGDLPGPGNPFGNTMPVEVLEESCCTDEGRAMAQIVHDMAPKARLGFATANGGELGFADNIRALAGFPGAVNFLPGFKADVIVDDIIYLGEPMFQDGPIAQAVDSVAATGVSYFSSAGNRPATQSYDSPPRIVPAVPASWANTNLNIAAIDPALYAGGFHDFDPSGAVDIAQTVAVGAPSSTFVFQWNEPFDPQPPTPVGAPLATGTGTVPNGGDASFNFMGTAGMLVEIFIDADNTTTGVPNPDLTLALFGPDASLIQFVDTGTNPESLTLVLPATGQYTVVVDSFLPTQFGDFLYRVQEVTVPEQVLSDYNLHFFLANGTYIGSLSEQNLFTNRPLELGGFSLGGPLNLQIAISRANVPDSTNANVATRLRYVTFTTGTPQEYFSYLGPVTYGHNSANGAMGVAAYPFFAPYVPEGFTSPGPSTIYFDTNNYRLPKPQIRQKPDLAAMDGANNTFFGNDNSADPDTFPNFFGTSAAAPHAAAVAALVLDAAGGPGKVKPNKMRKILQKTAFKHDLDPFYSSGYASVGSNKVAISAYADGNAISQFDPNVFTLWHQGNKAVKGFWIDGSNGNPTQTPKGVVFDERVGPGQPFVVGKTQGVDPTDVSNVFTLPADPPGVAGQWKRLNLSFMTGTFGNGDLVSFGVDRDEADAAGPVNGAVGGNSADLLGRSIMIPQGNLAPGGARFSGQFQGGGNANGVFKNLIGKGYSQLDGYGFVDAEAAVKEVTKKK